MDTVDIGFRNQVDDIRGFLDSRHLDHYTVYNLSPKSYRTAKFHSRVRGLALRPRREDFRGSFPLMRCPQSLCQWMQEAEACTVQPGLSTQSLSGCEGRWGDLGEDIGCR